MVCGDVSPQSRGGKGFRTLMTGHHRHTTLPVDYGLAHRPCKEEATYNLKLFSLSYSNNKEAPHLSGTVKVRTKSEVSLDRYLKRGEGLPRRLAGGDWPEGRRELFVVNYPKSSSQGKAR